MSYVPRANVGSALCNGTEFADIVSVCDLAFHDTLDLPPEEIVLDRQFLYSVYIHAPPSVKGRT